MKLSLVSSLCACSLFLASTAMADNDAGFNPLGPARLGVLVGVGLPSPVSGQLVFKYKDVIGANLELGELPQLALPFGNGVTVSQKVWDASVRAYPFRGDFFFGCGIGQQWIDAAGSVTQEGVTGAAGFDVKTTFVMPRLGLMHRFGFGLALGADIGVEIPFSSSTTQTSSITGAPMTLPPGFRLAPPDETTKITNVIQSTPIPVLHLIQVGYVF